MADLDRKDVKSSLIVITVTIIIAITIFSAVWISGSEMKTSNIITVFVIAPIFVILSWLYYFNQKKQDTFSSNQSETLTQKIIKTNFKASGIITKIESIAIFIISIIMVIWGILILIGIWPNFEIGMKYKLILGISNTLIGMGAFFTAIYLWKLGSVHLTGRMYKSETTPQANNS